MYLYVLFRKSVTKICRAAINSSFLKCATSYKENKKIRDLLLHCKSDFSTVEV